MADARNTAVVHCANVVASTAVARVVADFGLTTVRYDAVAVFVALVAAAHGAQARATDHDPVGI